MSFLASPPRTRTHDSDTTVLTRWYLEADGGCFGTVPMVMFASEIW